jgi:gliding motility-associated-like protein
MKTTGSSGLLAFFLALFFHAVPCSASYTITTETSKEACEKGAAGLKLEGYGTSDSVFVEWSNGQKNVFVITDLNAGHYNVHIRIKNNVDTVMLDTTIFMEVEKEQCSVAMANHFTPNGDDYNDTWKSVNTEYYPDFELYVYNKWGQQVHSQKHTYTPWDGKWNGINVPDGTYYYVFYYDGSRRRHVKGDLTILR